MATCTFPQTTRANQDVRAQSSVGERADVARDGNDALETQGCRLYHCAREMNSVQACVQKAGGGLRQTCRGLARN
jgi:hypothetical protein